MSSLLELLGRGLESPLTSLVLPGSGPFSINSDSIESAGVGVNMAGHLGGKIRLGIHYAHSGAMDRAGELFQEIIASGEHLEARLAWAGVYASVGRIDNAIEQLLLAHRASSSDPRVLFALGYCYERDGSVTEAERTYRQWSGRTAVMPQISRRLAAISLLRGDYHAVIDQYKRLREADPADVSNYLVLGQAHMAVDEYPQAIAACERALTIEPDNFELHDDEVEKLTQSGRIIEAIDCMLEIIERQGEFSDSYVRLADLYSQLGNDDDATLNYKKALQLHPYYLEAMVKLGTQNLRMGRLYDAASCFNQAIEINDRLILGYVGLGVSERQSGKDRAGLETIDLAVALEPNTHLLLSETARLQLRLAIAQENQFQPSFDDFLSDSPDSPAQQSDVDMDSLLDKQIVRHEQAIGRQPGRADLHYRYAMLLRGRGQTNQSIEHLKEAVELHPSYLKARLKLGLALRQQGANEEALAHFSDALRLDAETIRLHYKLGLLYCDRIHFAMAMEHFETGFDGQADLASMQSNLMLALEGMGLVDRATANWQAICELDPQSQLAFQAQRSFVGLRPVR